MSLLHAVREGCLQQAYLVYNLLLPGRRSRLFPVAMDKPNPDYPGKGPLVSTSPCDNDIRQRFFLTQTHHFILFPARRLLKDAETLPPYPRKRSQFEIAPSLRLPEHSAPSVSAATTRVQ